VHTVSITHSLTLLLLWVFNFYFLYLLLGINNEGLETFTEKLGDVLQHMGNMADDCESMTVTWGVKNGMPYVSKQCGTDSEVSYNYMLKDDMAALKKKFPNVAFFMNRDFQYSAQIREERPQRVVYNSDKNVMSCCEFDKYFEVISTLGRGENGEVTLRKIKEDGRIVAVKTLFSIDAPHFTETGRQYMRKRSEAEILREFTLWKKLSDLDKNQEYVVPLLSHCYCKNPDSQNFVMPNYGPKATLEERLPKEVWSDNPEKSFRRGWLKRVCEHLEKCIIFMHKAGIVHNDLFSKNVLIDPVTLLPQISDFGEAEEITDKGASIDYLVFADILQIYYDKGQDVLRFFGWSVFRRVFKILLSSDLSYYTHEEMMNEIKPHLNL
jgi:serine/threonine protein kinase